MLGVRAEGKFWGMTGLSRLLTGGSFPILCFCTTERVDLSTCRGLYESASEALVSDGSGAQKIVSPCAECHGVLLFLTDHVDRRARHKFIEEKERKRDGGRCH